MKRLLVDLTDVTSFARRARHVTGIQRVQLEVARALLKLENTQAFAAMDGTVHDVSALVRDEKVTSRELLERLGRLERNVSFPRRARASIALSLRQLVWRLRFGTAMPDTAPDVSPLTLTADDILYVGGAFWESRSSLPLYELAARVGVSFVAFIHDVIPLTFPNLTDRSANPFFDRMMRLPLHIIAASQFTREDMLRAGAVANFPEPLSVHVIPLAQEYPGAPRHGGAPAPTKRLRKSVGDRLFVLAVGTVEVRKNYQMLMKAWENMAADSSDIPILVIAGAAGWMAKSVIKALRKTDAAAPYIFVEAPTDSELEWLYSCCLFTVFASKAEGWGLPVGESLWFDKPCVASRTTSLPEVGGDLCDYIDGDTPDALAAQVLHLLRDEAYRRDRIRTIAAAKLRTWSTTSAEIAGYVDALRKSLV
jgi:glycosyltransferase involved in cell wall biosynthesis